MHQTQRQDARRQVYSTGEREEKDFSHSPLLLQSAVKADDFVVGEEAHDLDGQAIHPLGRKGCADVLEAGKDVGMGQMRVIAEQVGFRPAGSEHLQC